MHFTTTVVAAAVCVATAAAFVPGALPRRSTASSLAATTGDRVLELRLLKKTAESGLLTALEEKGVTLSDVEGLLPLAEQLGVLGLVADNAELIVEAAPTLLPLAAGFVKAAPITGSGSQGTTASSGSSAFGKTTGNLKILAPGKTLTKAPPTNSLGIKVSYATVTSVQDFVEDEVRFPGSDFLGISTPKNKVVKAKKVVKSVGKNAFNTPARSKASLSKASSYKPTAAKKKAPVKKTVVRPAAKKNVVVSKQKTVALKKVVTKPAAKGASAEPAFALPNLEKAFQKPAAAKKTVAKAAPAFANPFAKKE